MLDLNSLDMPKGPEDELDLGLEEKSVEESPLAEFSDEELLKEVENRGLIEPEMSEGEEMSGEGEESPLDL